jgi:hypothetical protein
MSKHIIEKCRGVQPKYPGSVQRHPFKEKSKNKNLQIERSKKLEEFSKHPPIAFVNAPKSAFL